MSTFKFGPDFFASLNPPKDAGLRASYAVHNPGLGPGCADEENPPPTSETKGGAFVLQCGAYHSISNGTVFDATRIDRATAIAEQHQKIWKALTKKGGKLSSTQQRLDSLSAMDVGVMMAIVHLVDENNVTSGSFLTFLGLPTTAMEGSGASLKPYLFKHSDETLLPIGAVCPITCQPILTTTLSQTRGISPVELKAMLWKHADSSLLFLDGAAVVEPLLIPNDKAFAPIEDDDIGHGLFLETKEALSDNLGGDQPPARILNGLESCP